MRTIRTRLTNGASQVRRAALMVVAGIAWP